jgi:hypothetical protein
MATADMLEVAGADAIAETPEQLATILLGAE